MKKKMIDLRSIFAMSNEDFVKNLHECFGKLNKLLKAKAGVLHEPLFVKEENGKIRLGYEQIKKGGAHLFSNNTIEKKQTATHRAVIIYWVIFEGTKEYGCYNEVSMPYDSYKDDDMFFVFMLNDVEYTYKLLSE